MSNLSAVDRLPKVLLLDDDLQDAERTAATLERDGYRCLLTRVASRSAFEAALASGPFDLILTEYEVPDADGPALLALARQKQAAVPMIVVTETSGEEAVVEALQRGAADWVRKGRLERLVPAIQRATQEGADNGRSRRAEAEVRETSRRKDEFLGKLGHELRNPLAALSNATALWRRKAADPAMQQWCVEVVERQTQNLMRLVDDMVDISRVLRDLIRLTRQPLELGPLVRRVEQALHGQAANRGVRVAIRDEAPGVRVDGDGPRLERVLGSLLRNAIQCAAEAGRVDVTIRRQGPAVEILVCDDGIGMTAEVQARVFDLFVQFDQPPARMHGGLGVNLTVARRLVELHGGTLTAASPGPGAGSTFTVRLDALAEAGDAGEHPIEGAVPAG